MEFVSILNDVLGPVMRGPSSSHTAGSWHIARLVRDLLGGEPAAAELVFDPDGSYAATYRQQGVDLAFAAGFLGWELTDGRFARALALAPAEGLDIRFRVAPLAGADHPNTVHGKLVARDGRRLDFTAESVGGGMVVVTGLDGRPVHLDGKSAVAVRTGGAARTARPLFFVRKGEPLFLTGTEMARLAAKRRVSLGRIALAYESGLLGLTGEPVTIAGIFDPATRNGARARRVLAYRLLLACGAGAAAMGGVDAIVFSGRYASSMRFLGPWLRGRLVRAMPRAGEEAVAIECMRDTVEALVAAQAVAALPAREAAFQSRLTAARVRTKSPISTSRSRAITPHFARRRKNVFPPPSSLSDS